LVIAQIDIYSPLILALNAKLSGREQRAANRAEGQGATLVWRSIRVMGCWFLAKSYLRECCRPYAANAVVRAIRESPLQAPIWT